jgi:3-carboxy-cis,cis-muconate cycloisomerase
MRGIFSDHGRLQAMLDFEAALARAEARAGVVSATAAAAIGAQCQPSSSTSMRSPPRRRRPATGDPPGERAHLLVAARATRRPRATCTGARPARMRWTRGWSCSLPPRSRSIAISRGCPSALAALARAHAQTPLAGRTWLQQGPPVTLGPAAGFLSAIERHRWLAELRGRAATLQFGGAVGTLAALGERGMDVASALAEELQLALPDLPWHAQRDRVAEVATTLGLVVGTLGVCARRVAAHADGGRGSVRALLRPAAAARRRCRTSATP